MQKSKESKGPNSIDTDPELKNSAPSQLSRGADMSDFIKPLINKKPDEIIIHCGTNDLVHVPNFEGLSGSEDRGEGDNSIQSINFGRVGDKGFK